MIDSHVHLNAVQFQESVDATIQAARSVGVDAFICIGYDPITNMRALEIAHKYPYVFATLGFHPEVAHQVTPADLEALESMINDPKVVGIGECGLDYYWDKTFIVEQKTIFKAQIEMANKHNLPLIVHMRDSAHDTLLMLQTHKAKSTSGIMHCYSGSVEMVSEFLNENLYISLAGPVSFKNAVTPKAVAAMVPSERLLIETDSPYLAPMPFRGKQNTPEYLPYVLKAIADIRVMDVIELDRITQENTCRLFKISNDFR